MFLDFFLLLKRNGLPVSMQEYLRLLEALDAGLAGYSVDEFYYLSRAVMVKHEQQLDLYDKLFGHFFKNMDFIPAETFKSIPEEWLRKNLIRHLTEEEKAAIEAMGGMDKLMERFKQLLEEQKERHEGGNKWIGTGGTSPFGANGYNPEGFRVGQSGSRNRSAVKVWDKREYRNLDENVELDTRNLKLALKRLRVLTREGIPEELDMENTIKKTSKNAGILDLQMVPSKQNRVKVLLLLDIGGSMDDHIDLCSKLFSAAKYEFQHLEYYYFHNCLYECVWKDNYRRYSQRIPTLEMLNKFNSDYKIIFVGDASMSPYELFYQGGSVEHHNEEPGINWLDRVKSRYHFIVWLNPVPEQYWNFTPTVKAIQELTGNRMFPLTVSGITKAMKALKDKKVVFDQ